MVTGFFGTSKPVNITPILFLLACVTALVIFPAESVSAAKDGLSLCTNVIIPSLFPFFVLSSMTISLGLANRFGKLLEPVMRPLFNVSGVCSSALVLGFIGGYPVGAKTVISLYQNGSCSKTEAERLLSFCNNSGPAFILGVVGAGIFSSSQIGLLLYLGHTAASICVGIIFRNWGPKYARSEKRHPISANTQKFAPAFTDAVKSSFQSTINICGFIIIFTVIIKLLFLSGVIPVLAKVLSILLSPFGFNYDWAERFITGLIELSSGVNSLLNVTSGIKGSIAMAAFMLGWAGLSVHCQVLSFIGGSGLSVKTYIIGKLLHGVLSAIFVMLLANIFIFDAPVSSYLEQQVNGIASLRFSSSILISSVAVLLVGLIFIFGSAYTSQKGGKSH